MVKTPSSYNESVIDYYDRAEVSYRDIWDLDRSMALHYGYWDDSVRSFPESLLKTNQVLAAILEPKSGELVLDAGCGVGGSSIFLAGTFGCLTTGISLSQKQVAKAKANSLKKGLVSSCNFLVADYTHTGFPSDHFDVVWALESVCHATDKNDFLKEAYRVLKPGGRLIIADGFKKNKLNTEEEALLQRWLQGWSIQDLETTENMEKYATEAGFECKLVRDLSNNIRPTSLRMYRFGLLAKYYGMLVKLFGKKYGNSYTINNTVGAITQYRALRKNLWCYMVFFAVKK